jgi:hypothetical protein
MLTARWPDDIRGTPQDRPKWHYINYPFKPPGEPASVHAPDKDNIVQAFADNLKEVQHGRRASDRAVALCWVFHLVGDVHQPLHTVQLFSERVRRGDHGGNSFYICHRSNENHPRRVEMGGLKITHPSGCLSSRFFQGCDSSFIS